MSTYRKLSAGCIIVFASLFSYVTILYGQPMDLVLHKNEGKRCISLKENSRIKIWTTNGEKLAGQFSVLNDSTILIDQNQIYLTEITAVQNCKIGRQVFGGVLLASGIGIEIFAFNSLKNSETLFDILISLVWLTGGTAPIVPGMAFLIIKPKYDTVDKWSVAIE